jgi:hypothetical protein
MNCFNLLQPSEEMLQAVNEQINQQEKLIAMFHLPEQSKEVTLMYETKKTSHRIFFDYTLTYIEEKEAFYFDARGNKQYYIQRIKHEAKLEPTSHRIEI